MNSTNKIAGLFGLLIVGGVIIIFVSMYIISSREVATSDAIPIYTGIVGFFATIITTLYKEFSERYAEKRANERKNLELQQADERKKWEFKRAQQQKRWELVFPILKDSYVPWINVAKKLVDSLEDAKPSLDELKLNRIFYFVCLFYGIRLRFILKHGGLILLGTKQDETNVQNAYDNIKKSFQWAGNDTPSKISELQEFFIRNSSLEDPLVFKNFEDAINGEFPPPPTPKPGDPPPKPQPEYGFESSRAILETWLNDDPKHMNELIESLNNFIDTFDQAISDFSGRDQ